MLKRLLLRGFSTVLPDYYERLLAHSVIQHDFKQVNDGPIFNHREALWDDAIERFIGTGSHITYVEFGVFEGHSIRYFAQKNTNASSRFIGLDSFEGLPEDWAGMTKGAFDVGGNLPKIDDRRVSFIKGWFQDTWDLLETQMRAEPMGKLVVHFDADLYSSTLFALSQMDRFRLPYVAVFDEFSGHETRALYNYCQAYGAKVDFYGRTLLEGLKTPNQVSCLITPSRPIG